MTFRNTAELLEALQWPVQQEELYRQALTHSSFAHEEGGLESNERLEFLGDAVLELVVSEYFFKSFPFYAEGKLTLMCHSVVNEKSLVGIARELELGSYLRLGKGEVLSGGPQKDSLLADALEALMGALFLDLGYEKARKVVIDLFSPLLKVIEEGDLPFLDYKTMFQERCQCLLGKTPAYSIEAESGSPHEKKFEAAAKIEDQVIGTGEGKSKKEAEQAAAKEAWERCFIAEDAFLPAPKKKEK